MAKSIIKFQSNEIINGYLRQNRESIQYKAKLTVKERGKKPVSLDLEFVPPHPINFNLPEIHQIKSESITNAYVEVGKYFRNFGAEIIK